MIVWSSFKTSVDHRSWNQNLHNFCNSANTQKQCQRQFQSFAFHSILNHRSRCFRIQTFIEAFFLKGFSIDTLMHFSVCTSQPPKQLNLPFVYTEPRPAICSGFISSPESIHRVWSVGVGDGVCGEMRGDLLQPTGPLGFSDVASRLPRQRKAFWDICTEAVSRFFSNRAFGVWPSARASASLSARRRVFFAASFTTRCRKTFPFDVWGHSCFLTAENERTQHPAGDCTDGWGSFKVAPWKLASASHLWNVQPLIHNGIPTVFSWAAISLIQTRCSGSWDKQWAIIFAISSPLHSDALEATLMDNNRLRWEEKC